MILVDSGVWIHFFNGRDCPETDREDIVIAARVPVDCDITAAVGLVSLTAALLLVPVTFAFDDFVPLDYAVGKLEVVVFLLAVASLVGTVLMVSLIANAGAVFGSQAGYVVTFAGVAWSMLLLNETLPLIAWIALGIMIVGLILVEPKEQAEERPDFNRLKNRQDAST